MSWQLRLLNAQLRLLAKPRIGRTPTPEHAARSVARAARLALAPPHLQVLPRPGGLYWIRARVCPADRVILYIHGGGFISGSPWTHSAMLGWLSNAAETEICAPRYPLLQDAPFPAPLEAARAAWEALRGLGYPPEMICLGGDSAGGGVALALLSELCAAGCPPAGAVVFSPWVDLTCSGASLQRNARADPLLPPARIGELAGLYLDGADPADPRASPLFADFPQPPPVWISYAETEILHDEIAAMAQGLRRAGGTVDEEIHANAPHVWPLFQGWIPEGRATLRRAGHFVQTAFAASKR